MNKYEFLSQLRNELSSVSQEERDAAMSYYEEFFSDAGEENEQAVIASLGSPHDLAQSIISENSKDAQPQTEFENESNNSGFTPPPTQAQRTGMTGGQTALIIILAILSLPIWIGLLSAVFGIVAGLFGAFIGITAALAACVVIFLSVAVAFFVNGAFEAGIFSLGFSLFCAGLFPLAIVPLCKLLVKLVKVCCQGIASLFRKLTGKKGVA